MKMYKHNLLMVMQGLIMQNKISIKLQGGVMFYLVAETTTAVTIVFIITEYKYFCVGSEPLKSHMGELGILRQLESNKTFLNTQ